MPGLVAFPEGVVTEIGPLFAPLGTVAVICVAELTINAALLLPNMTLVVPVKLVPLIVTCVPTGPLGGLKLLIVGAATTVKFVLLTAIPPGVVTEVGPVVAFGGTLATIFAPLNLKVAMTPLKVTCVAPFRLLPVMVTALPTPPLVGEKLVIVGGRFATTVNTDALVAVPPGVLSEMEPVVAPEGTVAVI